MFIYQYKDKNQIIIYHWVMEERERESDEEEEKGEREKEEKTNRYCLKTED